jgi:hypothetical protein
MHPLHLLMGTLYGVVNNTITTAEVDHTWKVCEVNAERVAGKHERKSLLGKSDVDGMIILTCSIKQWVWAGFVLLEWGRCSEHRNEISVSIEVGEAVE